LKAYFIIAGLFLGIAPVVTAQKIVYSDGRPAASLRMNATDEGIVMKYGDGPDSCDTYGAREAVVVKEKDTYYLFYDGAGKDGWISCMAESKDLKSWSKTGAILSLGDSTHNDHKSASSPWVIKQGDTWHMFYIGTPNTTPAPYSRPAFPYLTMKASSSSITGPWKKQYDITPLPPKEKSYYTVTSSPGFIVKNRNGYMMFFSGATNDNNITKRTLGIARTKDLNASWKIDDAPIFPLSEQVENSSLFFDSTIRTWFLFTNHIGINERREEYTDAIWVYWSKDINKWNAAHKAIVLDSSNCIWGKGAIGMPSVIKAGNRLAILYDAAEGKNFGHMYRSIGLSWLDLPLRIPAQQ